MTYPPSRRNRRPIGRVSVILLAALLGFGLGFLWKLHAREAATAHWGAVASSAAQPSTSAVLQKPPGPLTLAGQLQRQLKNTSPLTKWLCWVSALERATAADFPQLA